MRRYEKIALITSSLVLLSRFSPGIDANTKFESTSLVLYLVALSYIIGGYWIFRDKEKKKVFLPIIAGIALGTSFFCIPNLLRVWQGGFVPFLLLFNQLFFIGLGIYIFIKRKSNDQIKYLRSILLRSFIIGIFPGFLNYINPSNTIYAGIEGFFNNGNEPLMANLNMVKYAEEYKNAYAAGDCDKAIEYAEAANHFGKVWLGADTLVNETNDVLDSNRFKGSTENPLEDSLHRLLSPLSKPNGPSFKERMLPISGTFHFLYLAYKCKADNSNNPVVSINYYKKAYQATLIGDIDTNNLASHQTWLDREMGTCYKNMSQYEKADSLYLAAIKYYRTVYNKNDSIMAELYTLLAQSVAGQKFYSYAIIALKNSNFLLLKDSVKNSKVLMTNYFDLGQDYLYMEKYDSSYYYLKIALKNLPKNDPEYCASSLLYATYLYKTDSFKPADSCALSALECFKSKDSLSRETIMTYYMLNTLDIALGNFKRAKTDIDNGIRTISKNNMAAQLLPSFLLSSAITDKDLGEYSRSENTYQQLATQYSSGITHTLSFLINHALLYTVTGKFNEARLLADSSLVQLNRPGSTVEFSHIETLNSIAYIYYYTGNHKLSDELYQKAVQICVANNKDTSSAMALCLNGWGLNETSLGKYKHADSIFEKALWLHLKFFSETNPFTAILYLNYGTLKTEELDLATANDYLGRALNINKTFYDNDHDVFGDIYYAFGDLAVKQGNLQRAHSYYEQALEIYVKKFGNDYYKASATRIKLSKV